MCIVNDEIKFYHPNPSSGKMLSPPVKREHGMTLQCSNTLMPKEGAAVLNMNPVLPVQLIVWRFRSSGVIITKLACVKVLNC